jgi:hypothetical protein
MRAIVAFERPATSAKAPRGPLRRVRRGALERARHHVDNPIIGRFARRPRPRLVRQARQTTDTKPLAPLAHAVTRHVESLGHRAICDLPRRPAPSANRGIDFALVEPAGMARRVNGHQCGPVITQSDVACGAAMSRPVVHDPKDATRRPVGFLRHLIDEAVKGRDAAARFTAPKKARAVDNPGRDIRPGPTPMIFVLDAHRSTGCDRRGDVTAVAGLECSSSRRPRSRSHAVPTFEHVVRRHRIRSRDVHHRRAIRIVCDSSPCVLPASSPRDACRSTCRAQKRVVLPPRRPCAARGHQRLAR